MIDLETVLAELEGVRTVTEFIAEHCPDLLVISYMGVEQVVCSRGPFVQSFLDRLNQESFDKMLIRPALELCCVIVFVVGVDQIIFILRS